MSSLNSKQKNELLNIARKTVELLVRDGKIAEFKIEDEKLNEKKGVFVTLHKNKKLRGCIGQIIPSEKALWQTVRDMAIAACCEDKRFEPVSTCELSEINYEISVLSRPIEILDWDDIKLGKHGVIVRNGIKGGVFLPQVATEAGWTKEEFLSNLCFYKAGLAKDSYKNDPETVLEVFTAEIFSE